MAKRQKITPFLWYDHEAGEAARLYTSVLRDSRITGTRTLDGTPSGRVEVVTADLMGQEFSLMSAGPPFRFTPAVSFLVACVAKEEVDRLWEALSKGGKALMGLGAYPFSRRYGWVQDMYGLSWQLMQVSDLPVRQGITPTLMFTGKMAGRAEEAMDLYVSVFRDAKVGDIMRYGPGEEPDRDGTIKHGELKLEGQWFAAMDSARPHEFTFNEAISFVVHCRNQREVDHYWGRLTAVPEAEQCGWLKDRFGVSWQVVPTALDEMLMDKDARKVARVRDAFLKMKKLDIAALKKAYEGK